VDCPDVGQTAQGVLIADGPGGTPKALVVGFIGTRGTGLEGLNKQWVDSMVADGYQVVIVSWANETPWLQSASGDEVGARLLGCRPATAIKWVHDNIYDPMGLSSSATGVCGFCLTGNSGGASQIAYSLSFYGVAGMVDAAVLSGGPPHAGLDQGCLGSDRNLAYDQGSAALMDLSYGFLTPGTGPCAKHDQSFADRFKEDSVDVGGTYKFPDTRMSFLFVTGDHTSAPPHGMLYYDKVKEAGTPMVQVQEVPGQSHTIMISPEGRQAVEDELTAGS